MRVQSLRAAARDPWEEDHTAAEEEGRRATPRVYPQLELSVEPESDSDDDEDKEDTHGCGVELEEGELAGGAWNPCCSLALTASLLGSPTATQ